MQGEEGIYEPFLLEYDPGSQQVPDIIMFEPTCDTPIYHASKNISQRIKNETKQNLF